MEFCFKAEEEIRLPFFRENALRTALGLSLRRMVCSNVMRDNCSGCRIEGLCAYSKLFSLPDVQVRTAKGSILPYVAFFAPDTPQELPPGALFRLHLRLFGSGVSYFPYFFLAFEDIGWRGLGLRRSNGKRGRFALEDVVALLPGEKTMPVFSRHFRVESGDVSSFSLGSYVDPRNVGRLRVKLLSPLRVKHRNRLARQLDFHVLFRAVLRRISGLYFLAAGRQLDLDYQSLLGLAKRVETVEEDLRWFDYRRYSTTQQSDMRLGGLIGEVVYRGEITPLYPFVKAGELLGVGKGLTFGFGRYAVCVEEG